MRAAVLVLAAACGRVGFDHVDVDADGLTALAITPASARSNVNTTVAFTSSGGAPPYRFELATGSGELDPATGSYRTPPDPGASAIDVIDTAGATARATITYGGDEIYFIGGYDNGNARDEVYRTSDGSQWEVVGRLPAPRGAGQLIVLDDRMWWFGGALAPDTPAFDQIWSSADGTTWIDEGTLPLRASAQGGAMHRGRVWLAGGQVDGTSYNTAVWSSADGRTWSIEVSLPLLMHGVELVSYADELWLIAGHDTTAQSAAVRRRASDGTWPQVGAVPIAGEYHAVIAYAGRMWVAGGLGLRNRVVTSVDGVTWIDASQLPIPRDYLSLVELRGELWVVGGLPAQTWHTVDGASWSTAATLPVLLTGGQAVTFTAR